MCDGSGILTSVRAQDIIAAKRDGRALTAEQIQAFVAGITDGSIGDDQAAAWLMAAYIRGLDDAETAHLTAAMASSGHRIAPEALPAGALDKHSTGGVGDKTTLVVVPLLAAAGAVVCKMSGRGLGHTGGTLDKLAAIPGFRSALTPDEMVAQVNGPVRACLAGQTDLLAPADKKLYALRDATATVGSLPLIVSSILSKKLAGGAPAFLFDVKVGDGALMPSRETALALADALVRGASQQGRRASAVISRMDAPLGRAVGNALEVAEAIELLDPARAPGADPRLRELCLLLTAQGLHLALGLDLARARQCAEEALTSGRGYEALRRIVVAQGGDPRVIDDPARLPTAPVILPVVAPHDGFVEGIGARAVGEWVVALGGGRARRSDAIDPAVGVVLAVGVGDGVRRGETLARVHAREPQSAEAAVSGIRDAFQVSRVPPTVPSLIVDVLQSSIFSGL
jgi:pyrimidine-nucleoside phosphorylase